MKQHSCQASTWIPKEELPAKPTLRVIRRNHPDYGLTPEEIEERNEHIRCYILQHFELLLSIPTQEPQNDFFVEDYTDSAFNTHDYERHHATKGFDKYAYRVKKALEHVIDLAIMHSSISQPQGRENTRRRYEAVVENEYRERLLGLAERYAHTRDETIRKELKRRIGELNRTILDCKRVWERYSLPQNWDP